MTDQWSVELSADRDLVLESAEPAVKSLSVMAITVCSEAVVPDDL